MKKILLQKLMVGWAAFLLPFYIQAQAQRSVVSLSQSNPSNIGWNQPSRLMPFKTKGAFTAVSIVWYQQPGFERQRFFLSFSKNGDTFEGLNLVTPDPHAQPARDQYISQLYYIGPDYQYFMLIPLNWNAFDSIAVHFFDPGVSNTDAVEQMPVESDQEACPCPQPSYMGRNDWCPSGDCPPDATPQYTTADHLIIHHSAGVNVSSDWAAVVRSIWDYHVNSNGWDDIGYNWLIDPNGVLYEGRGDGRLGAHFCGKNGGTVGVCMMGDFTDISPTYSAIDKLVSLYSWNACARGIDPLGTSYHAASGGDLINIAGHRDGCTTSCPGDAFYPLLPQVRTAIKDRIENVCFGVAGSEEETKNEMVAIFPNPTAALLHIMVENEAVGKVDLVVMDAIGRQVGFFKGFEKNGPTGNFDLNLENLPSGMYWLKIIQGEDFSMYKFAKQ